MHNVLVVGANGTVGTPLFEYFKSQGVAVRGTTRRRSEADKIFLDLSHPPEQWPELGPAAAAYICAGAGRLDICEKHPSESRLINVERTVALAHRLHDVGMFVIFLSTNQVFDGTQPFRGPEDITSPLNEYGRQKVDAENSLLRMPGAAILRSTKIISEPFALFEQWRTQWLSGQPITAFDDIYIAPVPIVKIVEALVHIGRAKQPGIYQISGPESTSYYDLACIYARMLGIEGHLVIRSSAAANGMPTNLLLRHPTLLKTGLDSISLPDAKTIVAQYARFSARADK